MPLEMRDTLDFDGALFGVPVVTHFDVPRASRP